MNTFRHGGKGGDLIFSLPAIRELGGGVLYLPESTPDDCDKLYSSMKELMEMQPYISEVREYPSGYPYMVLDPMIPITYDLDRARQQPAKGVVHIVKRYLDQFKINYPNWKEPWLTVNGDSPIKGEYVVINYTGRHIVNNQLGIKSRVDWTAVHHSISDKRYFVGTKQEHQYFCDHFAMVDYFPTGNVLELARVIKGAKKVYLNQSLALSLSQSIGVEYWCDFKPGKRNCKLSTINEHEL